MSQCVATCLQDRLLSLVASLHAEMQNSCCSPISTVCKGCKITSLTRIELYAQVNLFIAVLKIKFAKAQTLFHSKLAKMSKKKRKNILGRALEKGQNSVHEQMKKKRDASVVGLPATLDPSTTQCTSCPVEVLVTWAVILHAG